jgi:hypothetical protein
MDAEAHAGASETGGPAPLAKEAGTCIGSGLWGKALGGQRKKEVLVSFLSVCRLQEMRMERP